MLQNPKFGGNLLEFKRALKSRDLFDNVYTDSRPWHYFISNAKGANKTTQTNTFELLKLSD